MEGSLVAYKVFSNGSVLQASEINDNLMNQSVAVFTNAAARTAAITSPVAGQLTFLEDTTSYEYYTGSAWALAALGFSSGLVHIETQSVSAVTSVIFNDIFSSLYRNYKVVVDGTQTSRGTLNARLRVAGVDASGSNYSIARILRDSTSLSSDYAINQTSSIVGYVDTVATLNNIEIGTPFLTSRTTHSANISALTSSGALNNWVVAGAHTLANSYDGINFTTTSNFTGTISVYGYRV
jgi:hypothetical protein